MGKCGAVKILTQRDFEQSNLRHLLRKARLQEKHPSLKGHQWVRYWDIIVDSNVKVKKGST